MLRDYQVAICEQVVQAFAHCRSVMVQMPTGTGKTWVLASLVERLLRLKGEVTGEVMIVAHRRELVEQIEETVCRVYDRPVLIRSIQWLNRHWQEMDREPSLVIVDEAHHALAATYRCCWERWPKAWFLGLTATPYRLSGEGFTDLFDQLVTSWSVRRFQQAGWLAGFDYYSIRPDSLEQEAVDLLVKRGADGDFLMREMSRNLDTVPALRGLYEAFHCYAGARKGLVYAVDVAHAEHIAAYYRERGVKAAAVHARMASGRRRLLLDDLRSGRLQVLVNVDLFSEGFDCPDVGFVQLARPTLSLAKFLQMVGRGLRRHRGKKRCVLLDNVGLYRRFGLPSADRDWHRFFAGWKGEEIAGKWTDGMPSWTGGRIPQAYLDEQDGPLVRIASEGMQLSTRRMVEADAGFERVSDAKKPGWRDVRSGVVFDAYPAVTDFGGIELASADGLTFYPRIDSPWIDQHAGINRKSLETQPYQGISWQRLYIPFDCPDQVFRLLEVMPNGVRLYEDELGKWLVQRDLDHALVDYDAVGDWKEFMAACEAECREEDMRRSTYKHWKVMEPEKDFLHSVFPRDTVFKWLSGNVCEVQYVEKGARQVCWVDEETGYRHDQRPYVFRRGFLSLLREGNWVFVRNIREEAGRPYRNWQVRCDRECCTVGDSFYFADRLNSPPFRIKKRSEDFRLFVLEADCLAKDYNQAEEDLMVINQPGKPLELSGVPVR